MAARIQVFCRTGIASALAVLLAPAPATAWSAGPREDVGVAAVDTRTGKVLWEAWRLGEVPAGASNEEKTAVEYLLAAARDSGKPRPQVAHLPDAPVKDLDIKNPFPDGKAGGGAGSAGKSLIYFRHPDGIIACDRATKKEVWRLFTARWPYASEVLEVGENLALVQIGSAVPNTIYVALIGGAGDRLAMAGLEPHTLKQRAAAAVLLHCYGDGYLRPEVQKVLGLLRKEKNDPAAVATADAVAKLLTSWPQKRDPQRLLDGCVASLLGTDGNPLKDFAWPDAHRVLAWCLFQERLFGSPRDGYSRQGYNYAYEWRELPVPLSDATKAKLFAHCRKVVGEGPEAEKPFAASVLVSTAIGWDKLTDAERKKLFLSSNPSAWRWAALALSANGWRKELMEWAPERPDADHLDVVWLLARDRKGWPEEELKFWVACARHDIGVAYVLRRTGGLLPKEFREPIRALLAREIAKPTVTDTGTQPAYRLFAALDVLDSWQNADDTALFLEYLQHPARSAVTKSDGTKRTELFVYELRSHARSLLEKRGARVLPGIVYEEVRSNKG